MNQLKKARICCHFNVELRVNGSIQTKIIIM